MRHSYRICCFYLVDFVECSTGHIVLSSSIAINGDPYVAPSLSTAIRLLASYLLKAPPVRDRSDAAECNRAIAQCSVNQYIDVGWMARKQTLDPKVYRYREAALLFFSFS